jgi:hypothetical protein
MLISVGKTVSVSENLPLSFTFPGLSQQGLACNTHTHTHHPTPPQPTHPTPPHPTLHHPTPPHPTPSHPIPPHPTPPHPTPPHPTPPHRNTTHHNTTRHNTPQHKTTRARPARVAPLAPSSVPSAGARHGSARASHPFSPNKVHCISKLAHSTVLFSGCENRGVVVTGTFLGDVRARARCIYLCPSLPLPLPLPLLRGWASPCRSYTYAQPSGSGSLPSASFARRSCWTSASRSSTRTRARSRSLSLSSRSLSFSSINSAMRLFAAAISPRVIILPTQRHFFERHNILEFEKLRPQYAMLTQCADV